MRPGSWSIIITAAASKPCSMAWSTGADVLEPLLPPSLNGELWLKDIKQRVGDRLALYGGFNERVLQSDDSEAVRREVRRCIDEGAAGGGYAIRCAGQIFDAE